MQQITSLQNPLVKYLFTLTQKSKQRKEQQQFLIEGKREISLALEAGYLIEQLFICPDILSEVEVEKLFSGYKCTAISTQVYEKLTYRSSTEGILALAQRKNHALSGVEFQKAHPLVLVAEAPEKPGNIGALLRTADAAGIDAVYIANPKTDLYNPNIIRSSVGTVFTVPIFMGSSEEIRSHLQQQGFAIYCAALTASQPYDQVSYKGRTAIVVGTEDTGLSPTWLKASTQNIIIPMQGKIDSMNVSVSAAILIFEAVRQRKG
ncbi:RNA methyltransferase [Capnocytophaga gingivalis]|uniref:RNA methyltransferase n=1 Tax=Capnocytophaga gingivalis TaxID=1017 RepID=A0ABU5Z7N2_9FLAO|nr:RNA methyltransferase [Capnocytophaga gingivalis]MEB3074965.1 RNA methyltransferase [Capnocytophaga gingivalis]